MNWRLLCLTNPHFAADIDWPAFVAFVRESYPGDTEQDIRNWLAERARD